MNEATQASIEALNAVAGELDKPVTDPKRFERRHTTVLPPAAYAHSRVDPGVSHMDAMLESKNAIHGDFTEDATTAQALKYVMRKGKNWEEMPPFMREALENMQTKVARILAGDFNHPDHWKDLQGYPRLVETRLEK